jgi:hypothetical protein
MEIIIFYIISFLVAAIANIMLRRGDENIHLIPVIWAIPYVNFISIIAFVLHKYDIIDIFSTVEAIYDVFDEDFLDDLFQ